MSLRSKFRAGISKCVYKHVVYSIPNFHALQGALFRLTQSPFWKYNILIFYLHGGANGQQGKKDNPHHRAYRRGGGYRGRVHIYVSRIPRRGKCVGQPRRIRFRSAGGHRQQRHTVDGAHLQIQLALLEIVEGDVPLKGGRGLQRVIHRRIHEASAAGAYPTSPASRAGLSPTSR